MQNNLVNRVTLTKSTDTDYRYGENSETVRVDLDLNSRASYAVMTRMPHSAYVTDKAEKEVLREMQGREIAHRVASMVRTEIEESVMRLLGFVKPGERGSIGRA